MNKLLEKFNRGEPTVGTFTHMKSLPLIECLGYTGMDYVILDMEHSPVSIEFVADAITAADAAGLVPVVRINEISRSAVLQPLDVGAKALIVPAIETVEQVQELVQFAKFPPLGNRGCCPTRDCGWTFAENFGGSYDAYMSGCNRDTLLIPQCETVGCLEHIEEIAATEGVDGIFIGPLDLSIALGVPGQLNAPELQAAFERVKAACQKNNKPLFIFCIQAEAGKKYVASGCNSVTYSLDALILAQGYRAAVEEIKGQ